MSASDEHLRSLRRRRKRPLQDEDRETEEPKPTRGLVSQGARSAGMPIGRTKTPDDLIRDAAARGRGSVWTRIA